MMVHRATSIHRTYGKNIEISPLFPWKTAGWSASLALVFKRCTYAQLCSEAELFAEGPVSIRDFIWNDEALGFLDDILIFTH